MVTSTSSRVSLERNRSGTEPRVSGRGGCGRVRPGLAALSLCVLALSGCTTGLDRAEQDPALARTAEPGAGAPTGGADRQGPERTGERVRVLGVQDAAYSFEVFAQPSVDGLCVELQDGDGGESLGCGFEVPERQQLGFFTHDGEGTDGDHDVVVGTVLAEAETVRVEFGSGPAVSGPATAVADAEADVFGIDVGARTDVVAVVALAPDGRELGRRPT